jgi:hypothetical protein
MDTWLETIASYPTNDIFIHDDYVTRAHIQDKDTVDIEMMMDCLKTVNDDYYNYYPLYRHDNQASGGEFGDYIIWRLYFVNVNTKSKSFNKLFELDRMFILDSRTIDYNFFEVDIDYKQKKIVS